ncbi:MAG: hypothetical protein Q4E28_01765 [Clostridia bacterium]|nr:hypothetical protein [Clostridia bacterium]
MSKKIFKVIVTVLLLVLGAVAIYFGYKYFRNKRDAQNLNKVNYKSFSNKEDNKFIEMKKVS